MTLTIHLLRQGQTALSRDDMFCVYRLDPELRREGLEMAHAFAAAYRAKPWRAIYWSGLRRGITAVRGTDGSKRLPPQPRCSAGDPGPGVKRSGTPG